MYAYMCIFIYELRYAELYIKISRQRDQNETVSKSEGCIALISIWYSTLSQIRTQQDVCICTHTCVYYWHECHCMHWLACAYTLKSLSYIFIHQIPGEFRLYEGVVKSNLKHSQWEKPFIVQPSITRSHLIRPSSISQPTCNLDWCHTATWYVFTLKCFSPVHRSLRQLKRRHSVPP